MNIENIKVCHKRSNMFYKFKKLILFFPIIFLLNACVNTGKNVLDSGKNVISSAKEKILNSENKDINIGVNLDEENSKRKLRVLLKS